MNGPRLEAKREAWTWLRKNWQILMQLELRCREHEKRPGHQCGCDIINMTGRDCLGEIGVFEKTQRYLLQGGKTETVSIQKQCGWA